MADHRVRLMEVSQFIKLGFVRNPP
jgi:hypothetical protein